MNSQAPSVIVSESDLYQARISLPVRVVGRAVLVDEDDPDHPEGDGEGADKGPAAVLGGAHSAVLLSNVRVGVTDKPRRIRLLRSQRERRPEPVR